MTHGDFEESISFDLDPNTEIISGYRMFMLTIRLVICPNGQLMPYDPEKLGGCYRELSEWRLPVYNQNQ